MNYSNDPILAPVNPPPPTPPQAPSAHILGTNRSVEADNRDVQWVPQGSENYLASLRQAASVILAHLNMLSAGDLFDLAVTFRKEVERRAMSADTPAGEADKWSRLLHSEQLRPFSAARALNDLREKVSSMQDDHLRRSISTDRMLREVVEQLDMLKLLRQTVARDGKLITTDPAEIKGVITSATSAFTLLMRFRDQLIDLEQAQKVEDALVEVGRTLPPKQMEEFLESLEKVLGEVR